MHRKLSLLPSPKVISANLNFAVSTVAVSFFKKLRPAPSLLVQFWYRFCINSGCPHMTGFSVLPSPRASAAAWSPTAHQSTTSLGMKSGCPQEARKVGVQGLRGPSHSRHLTSGRRHTLPYPPPGPQYGKIPLVLESDIFKRETVKIYDSER